MMKLKHANRIRRGAGAFTLLEIMVAIALLSVIVLGIYSSWNSIAKGSKVGLDAAAASQRMRVAMSTLQDSFVSACMFNENARYYAFLTESDGDFSTVSFVARLPRSFLRSSMFGDEVVRRVTFSVENGPDSRKRLILRQNSILKEVSSIEKDFPLVLANDVNKFILEYWDPQNGDWSTEWTATNQLPQMVRITLALGHLDKFSSKPQEAEFSVVNLPAQPVRLEMQAPQ